MNYQNSPFENDPNKKSENGYQYVVISSGEQANGGAQPPRPPKRGGVSLRMLILTVTLCTALSLVIGFIGAWYLGPLRTIYVNSPTNDADKKPKEETTTENVYSTSPQEILDKTEANPSIYGSAGEEAFEVSSVVRKVQDSVVVIEATVTSSSLFGQTSDSVSSGSGVVISEDGYVLTCHHVVENASSVKVSLKSGETYDAALVGSDSTSDLAVLKINTGDKKLVYAEQGCSGDLVVGEKVVAIGNPLGTLGGTVTSGIISATERSIAMTDGTEMTLIQTDAAINSGNSGGGLFNLDGQLIGVVNAKYSASGVEGLAFAIPIDSAYEVQLDLIEFGYVRGVVDHGLSVLEIAESDLAYYYYRYGLSKAGVYIVNSEYSNELKNADLIVSINGKAIQTEKEFSELIAEKEVGDELEIVISRKDDVTKQWKEYTVKLTLREYVPDRLKDSLN